MDASSKPNRGTDRIGDNEFFIPDLCTANSIFYLVLVVELLVLVLVLADTGLKNFSWSDLGLVSLFVQWVTLCSAGILCQLRHFLGSLGDRTATLIAVAVILMVTMTFSLLGDWLLNSMNTSFAGFDWLAIARNLLISLIMTGLVFRYLFLQRQLMRQKQAELSSRVQALQSRIRPHFLFNSMNIIASLISVDPDLAEEIVEDLSALFRASLRDSQGNPVKLSDELHLCERYIKIESLRMDERLQVVWDIKLDADQVQIPLLTLQPLLENAIYHGIQPLPEGGQIDVIGEVIGDRAVLRVLNPVPDQDSGHKKGNKMALNNIRLRLEALHGDLAEVSTKVTEGKFESRICIPMSIT